MTSFDEKKANALEKAIKKIEQLKKELAKYQSLESTSDLAIVGMGCHFPGGADSPEAFWENLLEGRDAISEVPKERWDAEPYFSPDPDTPGKINSCKGGFLKTDVALFDADFFGISALEAQSMDPQQRLMLEVTWQALENAAINPQRLKGTNTGIYIGTSTNDYGHLFAKYKPDEAFGLFYGTGNSSSVTAGRIAFLLGTKGPALPFDAACSSSLVALHYACNALCAGETDLAIVGGVNLILTPQNSIVFAKAHLLSESGHCKTFDSHADGYARSEGCGVVIVKRLADAVSAGDRIHAVIKGSALNHVGDASALTAPSPSAQYDVMTQALKNAQLTPNDIDFIEAHGTATAFGDSVEIEALKRVFSNREHPLTLGTVKTNIGHLESASGMASLIKVILSLQHETIPKHLHFTRLNPLIDLTPFKGHIPVKTQDWKQDVHRIRRAGISSFGLSGTNAHVIVEQAPTVDLPPPIEQDAFLFCFSAKTPQALEDYLKNFILFLDKPLTQTLHPVEVSYTLNTGRAQYPHRVAVIASTVNELKTHLTNQRFLTCEALEKSDGLMARTGLAFLKERLVDFSSLYPKKIRKIDLPYYVFQKQRYWLYEDLEHPFETPESPMQASPAPPLNSSDDMYVYLLMSLMLESMKKDHGANCHYGLLHHLILNAPNLKPEPAPFVHLLKRTAKAHRTALLTQELKRRVAASLSIADPESIPVHKEFIEYGVDSLMMVHLWSQLKSMVGHQYTLSKSILVECTSIAKLSEYFKEVVFTSLFDQPIRALPIQMDASKPIQSTRHSTPEKTKDNASPTCLFYDKSKLNIFLTGATGTLGGYFTKLILEETDAHLHCLVRAKDKAEAYQRIRRILALYHTKGSILNTLSSRVHVYCGDVSHETFSLSESEYHHLINATDLTIHAASKISLQEAYEALYDTNVLATKHMIKFALETKHKRLIYVSSYSVMGDIHIRQHAAFKESDFDLGQQFQDMAYQKTKFESERLIRQAQERGLQWRIVRPGNIFGESNTGRFPLSNDATPSIFYDLFKTVIETKEAAITPLYFDITPVDYVAKGLLEIALHLPQPFKTYHLTNPDVKTFPEIMSLLCALGYPIELVPADTYIRRIYTNQLKHDGKPYQSLTTSMVQYHASKILPKDSTPINAEETRQVLANKGIICPKIDSTFLAALLDYCVDKRYIAAKKPRLNARQPAMKAESL